jgi:hypothetical protein
MPETAVVRRFDADRTEWDGITDIQEFQRPHGHQEVCVIAAFVFFLLPVVVGYASRLMAAKVIG